LIRPASGSATYNVTGNQVRRQEQAGRVEDGVRQNGPPNRRELHLSFSAYGGVNLYFPCRVELSMHALLDGGDFPNVKS
jgi:hypothetical protein